MSERIFHYQTGSLTDEAEKLSSIAWGIEDGYVARDESGNPLLVMSLPPDEMPTETQVGFFVDEVQEIAGKLPSAIEKLESKEAHHIFSVIMKRKQTMYELDTEE